MATTSPPLAHDDVVDTETPLLAEPGVLPGTRIPTPQPLSVAEEMPLGKHSGALRHIAVPLVHHLRTQAPIVAFLLAALRARPRKTAAAMAVYWGLLQRLRAWKYTAHSILAYGSSNKPRLINCMQQRTYDPKKQYLVAAHPHGFLTENFVNMSARGSPDFKETGHFSGLPGLKFKLCAAPAVQQYPVFSELCGNYITDPSVSTVKKVLKSGFSPVLWPGGFSEAVYTGASRDYDYVYLAGRLGFLKLAIEHGIDIAPIYCFGLSDAYRTPDHKRHARSVWSQQTGLPAVWPAGKMCSMVPLSEDYCTALLDPFPTSAYTIADLEQCSKDYGEYLQRCFDVYKACVPSQAHKKLIVIGKDVPPEAALANGQARSRL